MFYPDESSSSMPRACQQQQQQHHHVRFDLDSTEIHEIERIQDMDETDRKLKWYFQQEFDAILADSNDAFKLMKEGEKDPERFGHCYRGLEEREREEQNAKRQVKSLAERAFAAVMKEQTRQWVEDVKDPDVLATIYAGYAVLCANHAVRQGRMDREEARAAISSSTDAGQSSSLPPLCIELEVHVPMPCTSGSGNDGASGHYEDDGSVVSDVSIDPAIGSTKSGKSTSSKVMGRIRKMIDQARMQKTPRTSVV